MGLPPKAPTARTTPRPAQPAEPVTIPAPAVTPPPEALPPVSAEEKAARLVIARYRQRLDWATHVPDFEDLFKDGLSDLGLPPPRRGIGLRALVDSMMLEHKK